MAALLALLSSAVWGTSDFLGGTLSKRLPAIAVVGGSQIFGLLAALLVATFQGELDAPLGYIAWGVGAGLFGLVGLVAFYAALSSGRMGIVSPISSLGVLVPLGIALITGEKPSGLQYVGILVAVLGVVLASGPELNGGSDARPVLLAFIAAATFGFTVYGMARGSEFSSPMTVVAMRCAQVSAVLVIAFWKKSNGGLRKTDIPLLVIIGSTDAIANILFTASTAIGMLSITSVLGSLFPVATVILAWIFHKERLLPIQYVGISATLIGVIAITAG